jgi:hypothetical protein
VRPYLKNTRHKKKAGGVAQGIGLEYKPQYQKKKKKNSGVQTLSMQFNMAGQG